MSGGSVAEKIGIGVVGTGAIASAHAAAVREHGGAEIVAVFDTVSERAEHAARELGVSRAAASLEELLLDDAVDAVIVATPPFAHAEAAIAALEAGKHVLCEKPLAHSVDEAQRIVRAADASSAFLACCSGRPRCTPAHQEARRLIDSGELGDVYHVRYSYFLLRNRPGHHWARQSSWFLDRSLAGGGALTDLGTYAIDGTLWLLGNPEVVSVTAQTYVFADDPVSGETLHDVEDHGVIMLQCEDGRSAMIEAAWVSNMAPAGSASVLGTKAGLRLDPLTKITVTNVGEEAETVEERILSGPDLAMVAAPNVRYVTTHFLDSVASGTQPETSGEEALKIVRILDAAYRSAAAGAPAALQPTRIG
jgi:predicted dehydrogenase